MLQCLAISTEANDLIASNPTLFWLLVTSAFDADWSVEDICRMCRFRQIDIVERINGHATKATVRLLRKSKLTKARSVNYATSCVRSATRAS